MKRRDMLNTVFSPDPQPAPKPLVDRARVPSGALRAMGLEIGRLTDEARQANDLRAQLEGAEAVRDLDPMLLEPSFMSDRLSRTSDADYRRLVDSLREHGQQVPILVRPHPDLPGRYQIAYGHRRREALLELERPVKAVIRPLTDEELVVAQGKENAERRNLTFIERALFAQGLERQGYKRGIIDAALGIHKSETSRLLATVAAIPADLIHAVGPAPKAGRPRWTQLGEIVSQPGRLPAARAVAKSPAFLRLGSDARFDALIAHLKAPAPDEVMTFTNARGTVVARATRIQNALRLTVSEQHMPGLATRLLALLPELIAAQDNVSDD